MLLLAQKMRGVHPESLEDTIRGGFSLKFADGVVLETNIAETMWSSCVWWGFRDWVTEIPSSAHFLTGGGGKLRSRTHHPVITAMLKQCMAEHGIKSLAEAMESGLTKCIPASVQNITKYMGIRKPEWLTSLDLTDLNNMVDDPRFKDVMPTEGLSADNVGRYTDQLLKVINTMAEEGGNNLADLYRLGGISGSQLRKVVGAIGFSSTADNNVIHHPVLSAFYPGMTSSSDMIIEGQKAAVSMASHDTPIERAGVYSKKARVALFALDRVEGVDCGTKGYTLFLVSPPVYNNGVRSYEGDLPKLIGMYRFDDEGETVQILGSDAHLIGTVIKLRDITHCQNHDDRTVCRHCGGELLMNISPYASVSVEGGGALTGVMFQIVMSTKHDNEEAVTNVVSLPQDAERWMRLSDDKLGCLWAPHHKLPTTRTLEFKADEAPILVSLISSPQVSSLSVFRSSRLSAVVMSATDSSGFTVREEVVLTDRGRHASFTKEFMRWLHNAGVNIDNGIVTVDVSELPRDCPLLVYQDKAFGMVNVAAEVMSTLLTTGDLTQGDRDPSEVIARVFGLINAHAEIPYAIIAACVYSLMVDAKDGISSPRGAERVIVGSASMVTKNRSFSASLFYNHQSDVLLGPHAMVRKGKTSCYLDVYLRPNEVVGSLKRGN
jgi:hypothetical protein